LLAQDGSPAIGTKVKVGYLDGHYGALTVFEGAVPDDGIILLEGITDSVPRGDWPGPYAVQLNDDESRSRTLGYFQLQPGDGVQDFEFRVVSTLEAGDSAPNVEISRVGSAERLRLSDLRGKIVFVEFWATWCAPCQEPMEKLNELASAHESEWNDDVVLVPISTDELRDAIMPHVELRGWTNLRHYWSGEDSPSQPPAKSAFAVTGVPTALLIDRDGKIVWHGHPASIDLAQEVAKLLAK
jgi:thiol-disulfide isomerase/thioredoxin